MVFNQSILIRLSTYLVFIEQNVFYFKKFHNLLSYVDFLLTSTIKLKAIFFISQRKETLPVSKIQSVKAVRKGIRDIPKAFEIFTGDETYTFKAKGQQNIQQWVQCLHIAVARVQKIDGSEDVPQPIQLDSLKPDNIVIERPRSVTDTKL